LWGGIVVGVVLLVAYQGLISMKLVKEGEGISQKQSNVVHLENLAYGKPPKVLLVGSSQSNQLPVALDNRYTLNAAQTGGCSQTTLDVLKRTGIIPRVVVIELGHSVVRGSNVSAIDQLLSPGSKTLEKHLSELQQRYNVVNVAFSAAKRKVYGAKRPERPVSAAVHEAAIQRLYESSNKPFTSKEDARLVSEYQVLKDDVNWLQSRGCIVVLHILPMDPKDASASQYKRADDLAEATFPRSNYCWFTPPSDTPWHTNDGEHLTATDASRYAEELRAFCDKLMASPELAKYSGAQP
jgi:hypothetical protein